MNTSAKLYGLLILNFLFLQCNGQNDDSRISQAEQALKDGASVSSLLSDPGYSTIHPEPQFRELIRKYADTSVLKINTDDEPGKKIRVLLTLNDAKGNPVPGASVYLYQTDSKGWYAASSPHVGGNEGDMRQARLFGYVKTNSSGQFELHTVKPSGYPRSDLPAHIHIHFDANGFSPYVTELLFDDDERLTGNVREQSIRFKFQIAKPETAPAGFDQQFSYQLKLNGN